MSGKDIKGELKAVATVVKALINSRKPPVFIRDIVVDYTEVEGGPLPFRSLGYKTPEDLLEATGEFKLTRYGKDIGITAATGASKSQHIMKFVRSQKQSKSRHINAVPPPKAVRKPVTFNRNTNINNNNSNFPKRRPAPKVLNNYTGDRNNNVRKPNNVPLKTNEQPTYDLRQKIQNKQQLQQQANEQPSYDLRQKIQNKQQQFQQHQFQQFQQQKKLQQQIQQNQLEQEQRFQLYLENQQKHQQQQEDKQRQQQQQQHQKQMTEPTLRQQQKLKSQTNNNQGSKSTTAPPKSNMRGGSSILQDRLNVLRNDTSPPERTQQVVKSNPKKGGEATSGLQSRLNQIQKEPLDKVKLEQETLKKRASLENFKNLLDEKRQEHQIDAPLFSQPTANGGWNGYNQPDYEQQLVLNHQLNHQRRLQQEHQIKHKQNQIIESNMRRLEYDQVKSKVRQYDLQRPIKSSVQDRLKIFKDEDNTEPDVPAVLNAKVNELSIRDPEPVVPEVEPVASLKKVVQEVKDPINELSILCKQLNYKEPEYSMLKTKFMRNLVGTVTIDGNTYSTYPEEFDDEGLATVAVARIALEKIQEILSKKNLPPCTLSIEEFVEVLHKELIKHPTGVFAKDIVDWYETTLQEKIHANWWTLVQISTFFKTEEICDNIIIFAIEYKKEAEESPESPAPTELVCIKPIELPWYDDCWSLFLTFCDTTNDVWARIYGADYSDRYDDLLREIEEHMAKAKIQAPCIKVQQVYLVYLMNSWHRVRVESFDKEKNKAVCLFIDYGDRETIEADNLYYCDAKFLEVPAQAVPFSLYGLEDFVDHPKGRTILEERLGTISVVARIFTKEAEYFSIDPQIGGRIKAVFYDTSVEEVDININDELVKDFATNTAAPELKTVGINHVEISHINERGEVYVRMRGESLTYILNLLQKTGAKAESLEQHKVGIEDFGLTTKFLFCDDSDKNYVKWYRGNLNTNYRILPTSTMIELFCVDIGRICTVHISKIYRLESLSAALTLFPPQAIKVRLFNILDLKPAMASRLRGLLPLGTEALVKVNKVKNLPLVTFYIRQKDGSLVNINDTLQIEQELEGWKDVPLPDDDSRSNSSKSDDTGSLKSPKAHSPTLNLSPEHIKNLPKLKLMTDLPVYDGICLEVRVTLAGNPWNFAVQVYERYNELKVLMKDLQIYCNQNNDTISPELLEIGQAYATKHADGYYHRVRIVTMLQSSKCAQISYVDTGDTNTVRFDQLKILPIQFRALPEMAIQAKLRSIKPTDGSDIWQPEVCLRFRQLTIGKPFIALLTNLNILPDDRDRLLEMEELIDVLHSHDEFISDILIKENRAEKVSNPSEK